ncbi:MAG: hypothetical protein ABR556_11160 [Pyrinomonadaceae bacterium]
MRTKRPSRETVSLSLLSFLIFFLVIPGQLGCSTKCEIDLDQAPEVRGFRLGMTLDSIRSRFPDLPDVTPDKLGSTRIVIENTAMNEGVKREPSTRSGAVVLLVDTSRYPEFSGARKTRLEMVDNRVASIEVVYSDETKWKSLEEFLKSVAEGLKVDGVWKKTGEDHEYIQVRSIPCRNFIVVAGFRVDPGDFVADKNASQRVPFLKLTNVPLTLQHQMRKEHEELQRKSSQP